MIAALLRLLLISSLVLNGSGTAMASVSMMPIEAVQVSHAGHDAEQPASAKLPCHMQIASSQSPEHAALAATGDAVNVKHAGTHPDPGCCGSGGCQCVCLQQALTVAPNFDTSLLRAAELQSGSVPAHAEPLIQNRIRPPIA